MADNRIEETARRNRQDQSGTGPSVQGRAYDPNARVGVQERMARTSLADAAKAAQGGDMPKQEPGEDAGAYSARLRKWRELQGQKKALSGMGQ